MGLQPRAHRSASIVAKPERFSILDSMDPQLSNAGPAWLEDPAGERLAIVSPCSLGRAPSNEIVLLDQRVSRRHAIIQVQGEQEYWLVDFGSRNGSYLNGQRLAQPTRLRDGDVLRFGSLEYRFRQADSTGHSHAPAMLADHTMADIRSARCWLLVADIIGSTKLTAELSPDVLPEVTGQWLAQSRDIIEEQGGRINQFVGDGFFAYWRDHDLAAAQIHKAVQALQAMQAKKSPPFRFVVHAGAVTFGGVSVGEEERISGAEVHFVFRMEKLASALGEPRLLSERAQSRLAGFLEPRDLGRHALHGFEGQFPFYAF
jgi:adenylate cyclase